MELKNWHELEIQLSNGVKFKLVHNLSEEEINAAQTCWLARAKVYIKKSFIKYINSKNWACKYAYNDIEHLLNNHKHEEII
jgi:hypothetical protein